MSEITLLSARRSSGLSSYSTGERQQADYANVHCHNWLNFLSRCHTEIILITQPFYETFEIVKRLCKTKVLISLIVKNLRSVTYQWRPGGFQQTPKVTCIINIETMSIIKIQTKKGQFLNQVFSQSVRPKYQLLRHSYTSALVNSDTNSQHWPTASHLDSAGLTRTLGL